jgi:protease-4
MKKVMFGLLLMSALAFSQSYYYDQNKFGFTSPGAMKFGLYGHDNPALLATVKNFDLLIAFSNLNQKWSNRSDVAAFAAVEGIGFSVLNRKIGTLNNIDYRFSSGVGNKKFGIGYSYGWSSGDVLGRMPVLWSLGGFYRPMKYLSLGTVAYFPREGESEYAIETAVRPLGDERISVFADYVHKEKRMPGEAK